MKNRIEKTIPLLMIGTLLLSVGLLGSCSRKEGIPTAPPPSPSLNGAVNAPANPLGVSSATAGDTSPYASQKDLPLPKPSPTPSSAAHGRASTIVGGEGGASKAEGKTDGGKKAE